jgi:hypothetical protein
VRSIDTPESQRHRVSRDVRDLALHKILQNKRSDFVLENVAQCINGCAFDDVLKLAADASVVEQRCVLIG